MDRIAIGEWGITLAQLMDQAGSHLAELVRLEVGGDLRGRPVVVAVGPGNNGGGGLAAARHLANRGASVDVVLARPALRMADAGRHQLATLLAMGTRCRVAAHDLTDGALEAVLAEADILVDALLGYGGHGALAGDVGRLAGFLNRTGRPIVSLDLPTGLDPDTGTASGMAISAAATLALALPKRGLLARARSSPDPDPATGRVYLADLGLPAGVYARLGLVVGPLFADGRIIELDLTR